MSVANATAETVIQTARSKLGAPYKLGTEGPNVFDCSGLIWYIFNSNGFGQLVGGGRHRAAWYARFFQEQGHFTTDISLAQRGDLPVYGHPGGRIVHIGLYLGPQRHRAISALINPWGVSRHGVDRITVPLAGFCQVQWPADPEDGD